MKKNLAIIFALSIPAIISFIWYRPGLIVATGETAIPFYSLERNAALTQHAWQEHVLGNPSGFTTISYPVYVILNAVTKVLPTSLVQVLLFWALMGISALSFAFLLRKKSDVEKAITICFYLCNIGIMVLVWNRFQYTFMFFSALLPAAFAVFKKGLDDRNWIYICFVNIILVVLSQSFSSLPLILLFWFITLSYTAFNAVETKKIFFPLFYLVATIGIWCLCNSWWIAQYFVLLQNPYVLQEAYSASGNKDEVIEVSSRLGNLSYVMRMMHKDFFKNIATTWRISYSNPLFVLLSYLITMLAYFPLLLNRKKPAYVYYFITGALCITFLAKGAAPPFGEIFIFFYTQFRFLEAFRNPFEKFTLALPFFYAPLIGYSLFIIYQKIATKFSYNKARLSIGIALIGMCFILVFPMWNRWVFSSTEHPSNNKQIGDYVQVPDYYKKTNDFINSNPSEFRNIALPIKGEGITYTWRYGYSGVEPLNGIFDKPIISLSTSLEFLKPIARQLEPLVFYKKESLTKAMQILNVRYLIVRDDIEYKIRGMSSPQQINGELTVIPELSIKNKFGAITIYENNDFLEKIYPAGGIILVSNTEEHTLTHVLPYSTYRKGDVFVTQQDLPKSLSATLIKEEINTAKQMKKIHVTIERPTIQKENALLELPHINYVAKSMIYPLVRLKEQWQLMSTLGSDAKFMQVRLAGKRLVEINAMLENNVGKNKVPVIAQNYNNSLQDLDLQFIYKYPGIQQELAKHEYILESLDNKYKIFREYKNLKAAHDFISKLFTSGFNIEIDQTILEDGVYEANLPREDKYNLIIDEVHEPKVSTASAFQFNGKGIAIEKYPLEQGIEGKKGSNTIRLVKDEDKEIFEDGFINRIIAFKSANKNFQQQQNPLISFTKINASEYSVSVKNAMNPYILVFSESFHPLWQAEIDGKVVASDKHFMVNNYANAWVINKKGDYTLKLYFKAENDLIVGKVISVGISVLLLIISIAYFKKKEI